MKSIYKLILFGIIIKIVISGWNGNHCTNDNGGQGWDGCICNGSLCDSCTAGNYYYEMNNTSDNHCCDHSCSKCVKSEDAKMCRFCAQGYYKVNPGQNHSYCSQCSTDCTECTSQTSCQTCLRETNHSQGYQDPLFQEGYVSYLSNGQCITEACDTGCSICYYPNNNLVCYGCFDGYYQYNQSPCYQCPQNCSKCNADGQGNPVCTECKNPNLDTQNNCQENIAGYSFACLDSYYSFIDQQNNYYYCLKCPSGCAQCYYDYTNQEPVCQLCELDSGDNRKSPPNCGCKSGFYENINQECVQCELPCLSCEFEPHQCLTCSGLYRDIGLNCACTMGYAENTSGECEPVFESWEQECYENLLYLSEDTIQNTCTYIIDTNNNNKLRYDFQVYYDNFILDQTCFQQILFFENNPQTFIETQNHKLTFSQYHEDLIDLGCQYDIGSSEYTWTCNLEMQIFWNGVKQRTHKFKMIAILDKITEEVIDVDLSKTLQEEECCQNPLDIETQLNVCTDSSCNSFQSGNNNGVFQFPRNTDIYFKVSIQTSEFIHYYLDNISLHLGQMILNPEGIDTSQPGYIIYHIRPSLALGETTLSVINQIIDPSDPDFNNRRILNINKNQQDLIKNENYYLKTQSNFDIVGDRTEDKNFESENDKNDDNNEDHKKDLIEAKKTIQLYKILLISAISVVGLLIILIISIFIYKRYQNKIKQQQRNAARIRRKSMRSQSSRPFKKDDSNLDIESKNSQSNSDSRRYSLKLDSNNNTNRRGSILQDMSQKYLTKKSKFISHRFVPDNKEEQSSIQTVLDSVRKTEKDLNNIMIESGQSSASRNSQKSQQNNLQQLKINENEQNMMMITEDEIQKSQNISNTNDKQYQKQIEQIDDIQSHKLEQKEININIQDKNNTFAN